MLLAVIWNRGCDCMLVGLRQWKPLIFVYKASTVSSLLVRQCSNRVLLNGLVWLPEDTVITDAFFLVWRPSVADSNVWLYSGWFVETPPRSSYRIAIVKLPFLRIKVPFAVSLVKGLDKSREHFSSPPFFAWSELSRDGNFSIQNVRCLSIDIMNKPSIRYSSTNFMAH